MKPRRILLIAALAFIALLVALLPGVLRDPDPPPGLDTPQRQLLTIWITSSPGGAQAWLTSQLRQWEKQNPGVMTHLRVVSPEEAAAPDAVLPDVILHMPGDFTRPDTLFTPLTAGDAIRPELLLCGQYEGRQWSLPLCWGAWVLAIDSALEPGTATIPAPTTLLGRPAATSAPTAAPGYPLEAASQKDCALQSPGGAALLAADDLLEESPPLPEDLAQLSPAEVYAAFLARRCASAMLTTGQATAFTSLVSAGKAFPFRLLVPDTVVTDQVWLASLTPDAPAAAQALLGYLTSAEAQKALVTQNLHTVRDDLTLYAVGFSAQVEAAGHRQLTAVCAALPSDEARRIAWQRFQGSISRDEALRLLR